MVFSSIHPQSELASDVYVCVRSSHAEPDELISKKDPNVPPQKFTHPIQSVSQSVSQSVRLHLDEPAAHDG